MWALGGDDGSIERYVDLEENNMPIRVFDKDGTDVTNKLEKQKMDAIKKGVPVLRKMLLDYFVLENAYAQVLAANQSATQRDAVTSIALDKDGMQRQVIVEGDKGKILQGGAAIDSWGDVGRVAKLVFTRKNMLAATASLPAKSLNFNLFMPFYQIRMGMQQMGKFALTALFAGDQKTRADNWNSCKSSFAYTASSFAMFEYNPLYVEGSAWRKLQSGQYAEAISEATIGLPFALHSLNRAVAIVQWARGGMTYNEMYAVQGMTGKALFKPFEIAAKLFYTSDELKAMKGPKISAPQQEMMDVKKLVGRLFTSEKEVSEGKVAQNGWKTVKGWKTLVGEKVLRAGWVQDLMYYGQGKLKFVLVRAIRSKDPNIFFKALLKMRQLEKAPQRLFTRFISNPLAKGMDKAVLGYRKVFTFIKPEDVRIVKAKNLLKAKNAMQKLGTLIPANNMQKVPTKAAALTAERVLDKNSGKLQEVFGLIEKELQNALKGSDKADQLVSKIRTALEALVNDTETASEVLSNLLNDLKGIDVKQLVKLASCLKKLQVLEDLKPLFKVLKAFGMVGEVLAPLINFAQNWEGINNADPDVSGRANATMLKNNTIDLITGLGSLVWGVGGGIVSLVQLKNPLEGGKNAFNSAESVINKGEAWVDQYLELGKGMSMELSFFSRAADEVLFKNGIIGKTIDTYHSPEPEIQERQERGGYARAHLFEHE